MISWFELNPLGGESWTNEILAPSSAGVFCNRINNAFLETGRLGEQAIERFELNSVLERDRRRSALREYDGSVRRDVPDLGVVALVVVPDYDCVGVADLRPLEAACQPYCSGCRPWLIVDNGEPKHQTPS